MLSWLAGNLTVVSSAITAVLVAIGWVFMRGKTAGRNAEQAAQQKRADKLQEHYDAIDQTPVDTGAAYGNLRKRLHDDG